MVLMNNPMTIGAHWKQILKSIINYLFKSIPLIHKNGFDMMYLYTIHTIVLAIVSRKVKTAAITANDSIA